MLNGYDRKILAILQKDGRITNAKLAERVALSPSACLARQRRLEEQGVISGYRAVLALEKARPVLRAVIHIRLKQHMPEDFRRVEKALQADPRIIEAAELSGVIDYYALLCVADVTDLRDCIDALIAAAPCVESVQSSIIMHEAKAFSGVPL